MKQQHYDVVIVGAGMAGMSTAYQLIGKAERVLICEKETPAHAGSSSFGDTRMYREMYSDRWLARVARQTGSLWAAMEEDAGRKLRAAHGLLFYGEDWGEETIEGSIGGAKRVMTEQDIPFREYDAQGIQQDFPLICEDHWVGLFEANAGAVLIEDVFGLWRDRITGAGFDLREHTAVLEVNEKESHVEVVLADGERVLAQKAILTAGPWTKQFLPSSAQSLAYSVWHMLWGYYTIDPAYREAFPQWFNFQHKEATDLNQGLFYGFPCLDETKGGTPYVKVGIDWTSDALKHPAYQEGISLEPPADLLGIMDGFVEEYVQGIDRRFHAQLNPYTMSSDVQFCLDKLSQNVSVFSHGSGQAFKFAPMIGTCLATMATGAEPPIDLTPWRLERLVA